MKKKVANMCGLTPLAAPEFKPMIRMALSFSIQLTKMQLLCDDNFAPITTEIGFLEAPASKCAEAFIEWQTPLLSGRGGGLESRTVDGGFRTLLESVLPLTSIERRRYLFVPTQSQWTSYFDNGWTGGDPASTIKYLAGAMRCRGIRAVCVPNTIKRDANSRVGRYGAVILEVYQGTAPLKLNTQRSIYVSNDGGRWVFGAHGEPLDFENVEEYKARSVRDRFTAEMLSSYLNTWGIAIFSETFYSSGKLAVLVSKTGPCAKGMQEYSLERARASF